MTFSFQQTRGDVAAASAAISRRPIVYGLLIIWLIAALAAISTLVTVIARAGWHAFWQQHGITGFIPTLVLILLFSSVWLQPRLAARNVTLHEVEWHVTDAGVRLQTPEASSEIRWPAFLKYRETSKIFLLYLQRNQAQFVPKRALTPEQLAEFRALLSTNIGKDQNKTARRARSVSRDEEE